MTGPWSPTSHRVILPMVDHWVTYSRHYWPGNYWADRWWPVSAIRLQWLGPRHKSGFLSSSDLSPLVTRLIIRYAFRINIARTTPHGHYVHNMLKWSPGDWWAEKVKVPTELPILVISDTPLSYILFKNLTILYILMNIKKRATKNSVLYTLFFIAVTSQF